MSQLNPYFLQAVLQRETPTGRDKLKWEELFEHGAEERDAREWEEGY